MLFNRTKTSVFSAALALGSLVMAPALVQAATVTYDFGIQINFGPLLGQMFNGNFSYNDAVAGVPDPGGFTSLPITDFSFTFLGNNFTEADDLTADVDVLTSDLSFLGLNYSTADFSFVSGAFTLNLADSYFSYDLGTPGAGTGTITFTLRPPSPDVPEPATVVALLALGTSAMAARFLKFF